MPGGAGLLLAILAGLVLPGLVRVMPLLLLQFLLLGLLGLLARLPAGFLAGLLVGHFWAMFVCIGLLVGLVLAVMFVTGGAFLLPVAGVWLLRSRSGLLFATLTLAQTCLGASLGTLRRRQPWVGWRIFGCVLLLFWHGRGAAHIPHGSCICSLLGEALADLHVIF